MLLHLRDTMQAIGLKRATANGEIVMCVRVRDDRHYIPKYCPSTQPWDFVVKIPGMVLAYFPTDDELFDYWEEFCASYANAQVEHISIQRRMRLTKWSECFLHIPIFLSEPM